MYSLKPGRGPSGMSAVGGVAAVIFGVFWTILAYSITEKSPFPMVHILFPLFGVVFVISGIIKVIYNLSNATRQDRFSMLDITTDREEPDPLNQIVHGNSAPDGSASGVEGRLKEIDALLAKGIISQAEHDAQRDRILREI